MKIDKIHEKLRNYGLIPFQIHVCEAYHGDIYIFKKYLQMFETLQMLRVAGQLELIYRDWLMDLLKSIAEAFPNRTVSKLFTFFKYTFTDKAIN